MSKLTSLLRFLVLIAVVVSCAKAPEKSTLQEGTWKGIIRMQNQKLPFLLEISKENEDFAVQLINGSETFEMDEVQVTSDSLKFSLHIFDISIKAKINGDQLEGVYTKNYLSDYELPFTAEFNKTNRFIVFRSNPQNNGKWDMTFYDINGKTSKGIGVFDQIDSLMTGTILTPTGDYRFLEGTSTETDFALFTFDGNHAFVFDGQYRNDSIFGTFYSGKTYYEHFIGLRNPDIELPNPNELTFLKEGYDKLEFTFPDLDGTMVSLTDEKYQDKVVLVQIFGTWCPNCMDETVFYRDWHEKNKDRGVEIIGLAYEIKDDFEYAKSRVEKMKKNLNVDYDFLIAGTADKEAAGKTLPMLNHIMSFPTTIFIDRTGKVRKIHTGFNGPATGDYYAMYVEEFNFFMDSLLSEK